MQTKTLPYLTFYQVAAYCSFDVFAGDSQAQTRVAKVIFSGQDRQVLATELAGLCENAFKIFRFEQP